MFNDAMVTVCGNVATKVDYRDSVSGPVARFRLASTARRWDKQAGRWADGHTNFFTVWASRQLAANLAASVSVGEPLVVQGRLKVREEKRGDGERWFSADLVAVAAGHDLSRGTSAFRRAGRGGGGEGGDSAMQAGAGPSAGPPDVTPPPGLAAGSSVGDSAAEEPAGPSAESRLPGGTPSGGAPLGVTASAGVAADRPFAEGPFADGPPAHRTPADRPSAEEGLTVPF